MSDSGDSNDSNDANHSRWLNDATAPAKRALREALDDAPRFTSSDVRQRRVWARVADPPRARRAIRRAFVMGALVASGLGVVALALVARLNPGLGVFVSSGKRTTALDSIEAAPPRPEPPAVVPLSPGAVELVRTGSGQRVTRPLVQDAEAELQPNSLLALDEQGAPEVRAGQIAFKVGRQKPGQRFRVRAGRFTVVVVGTRFVVNVNEAVGQQERSVAVSVDEGVVEIWAPKDNGNGNGNGMPGGQDRVARLGPGQSWTAEETRGGGEATRAPTPIAVAPRREQHPRPGALPPSTSAVEFSAASGPEERASLSAARAVRAAADPKRALDIYRRLAERRGPVAENALYELGGIYRDQLRQPRQALATWERYRTQYPRGLLRAEADLSIVDTLSSMGESTRALKEALAFLKNHPRSERRGEIARVAGDLYRARGQCRDAAELYSRVDGTLSSEADADDAAYGRAACLEKLGDPGAVPALQEYLGVRPAGRHSGEAARLLGLRR